MYKHSTEKKKVRKEIHKEKANTTREKLMEQKTLFSLYYCDLTSSRNENWNGIWTHFRILSRILLSILVIFVFHHFWVCCCTPKLRPVLNVKLPWLNWLIVEWHSENQWKKYTACYCCGWFMCTNISIQSNLWPEKPKKRRRKKHKKYANNGIFYMDIR